MDQGQGRETTSLDELKRFLRGKWIRVDSPFKEVVFYFYPKSEFNESDENICLIDDGIKNNFGRFEICVYLKNKPQKNPYFIVDIDKKRSLLSLKLNEDVFNLAKVYSLD